MDLRLHIPSDLTLGDMVELEDAGFTPANFGEGASPGFKLMRDILSRFVETEDGDKASPEEALAIVNKLTLAEMQAAVAALTDALRGLAGLEEAIPKGSE
jgi:hypothetical protein